MEPGVHMTHRIGSSGSWMSGRTMPDGDGGESLPEILCPYISGVPGFRPVKK